MPFVRASARTALQVVGRPRVWHLAKVGWRGPILGFWHRYFVDSPGLEVEAEVLETTSWVPSSDLEYLRACPVLAWLFPFVRLEANGADGANNLETLHTCEAGTEGSEPGVPYSGLCDGPLPGPSLVEL